MKLPLLTLLLAVFFAAQAQAEDAPPLIPVETFFRHPEISRMELSPNGESIAYLAPFERRQNLYVRRVDSADAVRLTASTARDLGGFFWIGDNRLVYSIDEAGKENWQIHAVDRDGGNARALTPERGVQAKLVSKLRNDPDHLLVTLNQRDPRMPDLHRINVHTGETTLLVKNDRRFVKYVADNAGVVRLAVATDGVNMTLFHRDSNDASFEKMLSTDFRESINPLSFTSDNQHFYATSNRGRDKAAIVLVETTEGREIKTIFDHPEFDVTGIMRDDKTDRVTGAHFVGDKPERHYFDEVWRNRHAAVAKQLPDLALEFTSSDRAARTFIIKAWSDRDPGTFYLYRDENGTLTRLGSVAPWIEQSTLVATQPIAYRSRDGLTIRGYLTQPKNAQQPGPAIVVVHGGPWARVQWRADPEIQFLANRGYTVLQMNFRGSTGYGRAFVAAGFKQWGRTMQDDVTDGVRWLIDQKLADPARIGLYGISYGGYATLAGLAFTPELYRCGINDCGVSDIREWLEGLPPAAHSVRSMLHVMVGHPELDRDALDAVSPLKHASRIKAPLLLAHGNNDPRVPRSHSDNIAKALSAQGVDVDFLSRDNEGHSFHLEENKVDFYRRVERFLAKHLGGRSGSE